VADHVAAYGGGYDAAKDYDKRSGMHVPFYNGPQGSLDFYQNFASRADFEDAAQRAILNHVKEEFGGNNPPEGTVISDWYPDAGTGP